jgi:Skp family chaperone for outer membrane proteins
MKSTKYTKMFVAAAVFVSLAAAGIGVAKAQNSALGTNPMSSLVNAISQKFNLNTADVQQVFEQHQVQMHEQRQGEMQSRLQSKFSELVSSGKLTQQQADQILAKYSELQKEMQANKVNFEGKTQEERQALMKQHKEAMEVWAQENNIPLEYLGMGYGRGPGAKGMGFRK